MLKFSIIIPCYNSIGFMEKCLKSLEEQTLKEFEVIFIDDCSKDDTYAKLLEYQKKSKLNMTILKNEKNLGPGKTRNVGIEKAIGKFILFIDADDYIEENSLEIIDGILKKDSKIDCVIFDFSQITKNNVIRRRSFYKANSQYLSKNEALIYVNTSTCGKVYLLENIKKNNVIFPELMRNEDFPFNKLALAASNKIYYCDNSLYNYVDNKNSLIHNQKFNTEKNNLIGFEIVEKNLKNKYDKELESIFVKEYLYAATLNLVERDASSKEIKEHIDYCQKKYPDIYKNEIIKNMNIFQRMCIMATKIKSKFLLKLFLKIKKIIKKVL